MAWYSTGTVSVTNGGDVVTGAGTAFFGALQAGWGFVGPDGRAYEIETVDSATQITLKTNYQGSTAAAQLYACFPTMSLAADLAGSVQALIADFQAVVDGAGAGKFGDGTQALPGIAFAADADTGIRRVSGNKLALVAGGNDQLVVSGGVATGAAVQSSTVDAGVGRLLTVGAFGLGASAPAEALLDSTVITGLYSYRFSDTGNPATGSGTFQVLRSGLSAGAVTQIAWPLNGGGEFRRFSSDGGSAWSGWVRRLDQVSILGTVSEAAGVPTGAAFEAGSNANGEYTRFADGTQICTYQLITDAASSVLWTFPAVFAGGPRILLAPASGSPRFATHQGVGATGVYVNGWDTSGARQAFNCVVLAVGRWF